MQQARERLAGGDPSGALALLSPWVDDASPRLDLLLTATNACQAAGDTDGAQRLIDRAVEHHPRAPEAHYFAGLLRRDRGDLDAAVAALERARNLAPAAPEILLQLGALHELRWRPDEAEGFYRQLVVLAPAMVAARDALARVQLAQAKPFEAEATCRQALAEYPDYAPLHATLGAVLQRAGRLAQAEAAYQQALTLQPAAGVWNNLGLLRRQRGNLGGAFEALRQGNVLDPAMLECSLNLADVLSRLEEPAAAAAVCDDGLAHHPRDGTLIALKALALRDAGRLDEAERLVDFERFVAFQTLPVPDAYADAAAFHAALAAEVTATPSRASEPGTEDGRQTLELFPPKSPALAALHEIFDRAVHDYASGCQADSRHPFLAAIPRRWRLSAWATLMRRIDEPETTHLHPPSWLSGVCYIALPDAIGADADESGWLEFGRPALNLHHCVTPAIRTVRPEPGRLVLFPGYFFHRVRPFSSTQTRISIAFDAVPA